MLNTDSNYCPPEVKPNPMETSIFQLIPVFNHLHTANNQTLDSKGQDSAYISVAYLVTRPKYSVFPSPFSPLLTAVTGRVKSVMNVC